MKHIPFSGLSVLCTSFTHCNKPFWDETTNDDKQIVSHITNQTFARMVLCTQYLWHCANYTQIIFHLLQYSSTNACVFSTPFPFLITKRTESLFITETTVNFFGLFGVTEFCCFCIVYRWKLRITENQRQTNNITFVYTQRMAFVQDESKYSLRWIFIKILLTVFVVHRWSAGRLHNEKDCRMSYPFRWINCNWKEKMKYEIF